MLFVQMTMDVERDKRHSDNGVDGRQELHYENYVETQDAREDLGGVQERSLFGDGGTC
jgi:hypothetical protein